MTSQNQQSNFPHGDEGEQPLLTHSDGDPPSPRESEFIQGKFSMVSSPERDRASAHRRNFGTYELLTKF